MVVRVFMSHTKLDYDFCNRFMAVAASEGIKPFRSEFEEIKSPSWKTIKEQMDASSAMFLLVGKELVKAQEASNSSAEARGKWKYTQNWVAYEIGLACERGIDVWVCCDGVKINFPVPYLNNYTIYKWDLRYKEKVEWWKWVFEQYNKGKSFPLGGRKGRAVACPNKECKAEFNLHSIIEAGKKVVCPTCLKEMVFEKGWLI